MPKPHITSSGVFIDTSHQQKPIRRPQGYEIIWKQPTRRIHKSLHKRLSRPTPVHTLGHLHGQQQRAEIRRHYQLSLIRKRGRSVVDRVKTVRRKLLFMPLPNPDYVHPTIAPIIACCYSTVHPVIELERRVYLLQNENKLPVLSRLSADRQKRVKAKENATDLRVQLNARDSAILQRRQHVLKGISKKANLMASGPEYLHHPDYVRSEMSELPFLSLERDFVSRLSNEEIEMIYSPTPIFEDEKGLLSTPVVTAEEPPTATEALKPESMLVEDTAVGIGLPAPTEGVGESTPAA